jgi:lipopolysaccharide export LptBFGC system permease protein LptF
MTLDTTSNRYTSLLLTFLAGAAVGATVVAFSTRKTGPQRIAELKELAAEAKAKAVALAEAAGEAWEEGRDRTTMAANDLKRGFTDAATDLRG